MDDNQLKKDIFFKELSQRLEVASNALSLHATYAYISITLDEVSRIIGRADTDHLDYCDITAARSRLLNIAACALTLTAQRYGYSFVNEAGGSDENAKDLVLQLTQREYDRAVSIHAPMANGLEAYAVILEEVGEFWDIVKLKSEQRSPVKLREELIQIAAMCCRAVVDLCLI